VFPPARPHLPPSRDLAPTRRARTGEPAPLADFDLLVIGGGSGGVACARRAASHGARVGLAEASRVGGTCVIRGCVPKKLMHYGAHMAEYLRMAGPYGWDVGAVEGRFERLLENRNREIERLNGIYVRMLEDSGVRVLRGYATLRPERDGGAFLVDVAGERVSADRVLVAVGGRPSLPEIEGRELALTSDEVLEEVYPLPRRLVVVGGGYIGVEFASIMHAFGAETTLVIRGDRPLRGFDHDLRDALTAELERDGLKILRGAGIAAFRRGGDGGVLVETDKGSVEADKVVLAIGRRSKANTDRLGLEAHGVRVDSTGAVLVDKRYESNVPGLFAVGDSSDHAGTVMDAGRNDLTPVAIAEGRALAETLFNDNPVEVSYGTIPTAVFGLPQAAAVGLTEERARALGHEVEIYRTRFRPMLYTIPGGERRTMMKLVVDKATDRVLGCHMVGDDAGEIVQGFAVALCAGATKRTFDSTVALHPTAAEEFVTMYKPVQG
jgi:glutathione reductase (NADPH)